jgi:ssDNA-binding Zn-finger/Zn-ribbon topoisomerase 1
MKDDKCDSCGQEMDIQRSSKRSRFLVCRNTQCKRGQRNAPPVEVNSEKKQPVAAPVAKPKRTFGGIAW